MCLNSSENFIKTLQNYETGLIVSAFQIKICCIQILQMYYIFEYCNFRDLVSYLPQKLPLYFAYSIEFWPI